MVLISERDIATTDLVQAQPEDSIASVGQMMLEPWVRHIAVWEGDAVVVLGVDL